MNVINFGSIAILVSLLNFLLQANQTQANYLDDFAYDEPEVYENSYEKFAANNYRNERDLRLSQIENKKIGNILNSIRKNLYEYIIERDSVSNQEDLQGTSNESVQNEKKEKKPTIRIPFKWGR
jgi:hypothetical protein